MSVGASFSEDLLTKSLNNVDSATKDNEISYGGAETGISYPLRPYASDCPHFLRTGACKYTKSCKFNHPLKKSNLVANDKKREVEFDYDHPEAQIQCKFYSTGEGCKYGEACRYNHSKLHSDVPGPELNILGLPIRAGEKSCPYFMRKGFCGYGALCIYDHPDPTLGSARASRAGYVSWSSTMPAGMESYQVPDNLEGRNIMIPSSAPAQASFVGSSHPKDLVSTGEQCVLSAVGLPLRPDKSICRNYKRFGVCKFGSACHFDHPESLVSRSRVRSRLSHEG